MPNETQCPHWRIFTKDEWYRIILHASLALRGTWATCLWRKVNAETVELVRQDFDSQEVQRVDAAAKRAGISN